MQEKEVPHVHKNCAGCLWHWPSLTPGEDGVYRCYHRESTFFHEISKHKCKHFERRFPKEVKEGAQHV